HPEVGGGGNAVGVAEHRVHGVRVCEGHRLTDVDGQELDDGQADRGEPDDVDGVSEGGALLHLVPPDEYAAHTLDPPPPAADDGAVPAEQEFGSQFTEKTDQKCCPFGSVSANEVSRSGKTSLMYWRYGASPAMIRLLLSRKVFVMSSTPPLAPSLSRMVRVFP